MYTPSGYVGNATRKCVAGGRTASYLSDVIATTALLEHGHLAGSAVAWAPSALAAALEAGLRS